jgi:ABC-2 type transport system permease protein
MDLLRKIKRRYSYSFILLKQLVITDFKLRYQGSALGYLWSLLRPLFIFVILYLVFVKFLPIGNSVPHYSVYLLVGIVLWNFFNEITSGSVGAIVGKGDLLRKINFPKYVVVISNAVSALINLCFNAIVIVVFMYFNKVNIGAEAFLLPVLILELFLFGLALAFFLSALFVRLRDINYVWEVIMQAAFYATPILYPLQRISEKYPHYAKFFLLNPVAQVIQDVRHAIVTPKTETVWQLASIKFALIPIALVVVTMIGSFTYFRKRSPYFAEEI